MNHTACFEDFGPRCTFPEHVAPNDAIAGLGVLISFVVLSALCALGTIFACVRRCLVLRHRGYDEHKLVTISSIITILFGDTMLVASIAISLSALILQRTDSIIVYHYNIVCNLAIAATFTSLTTTFALPLFTADRWTSSLRILLYVFQIGLLAALLILRVPAGGSYPGRVPTDHVQKTSAMVLQTSCFFRHPVPTSCTFSTDRRPLRVLSDAWALALLAFIVISSIGAQCVPTKIPEGMLPLKNPLSSAELADWKNNQKFNFYGERAVWEFFVILVSMTWTVIALWQAFSLRQWMNSSGWFEDSAGLGGTRR